jgi:uncharacterized protein
MPELSPEQRSRVLQIALDHAREGATDELAEFLDHGLPVDECDAEHNSLLMLAAYHDRPATVRMLLQRGADPELRNDRDQSPIAGALFKGADEVVDLLRAAGADPDAGTPSAREIARMFGRRL